MKRLTLFGTLCLTLLMTAVNGNAAAPYVSSSPLPAASSGVAVATTASVIFDQAMKISTLLTSTFKLKDTTYGNSVLTPTPVNSNGAKTFTITPSSNLAYCTSYTLIVTTGVQNSGGTNMTAPYSRTFATSNTDPSPTVTVAPTSPTSGQTGVIESAPITFTFNKLMDPTTINDTTFTLVDTPTSTLVPGNITSTVTTTNKTIVTFQPSVNLVSSTQYRATVFTGANSMCGASVATTSWTFTVRDTIAPYVLSTVPSNNASQIPRTSPITINFSEAVQTITAANITVNDGTSNIAGIVTFDSVSKLTATFTPSSAMKYDTIYTVTVTGAKDLIGNTMSPSPYTFQFITSATTMDAYCQIPPFIGALVQPNVLLILDNSNSMDEDFLGNAVGSWNVKSKAVNGKSALISLIQKYADSMRIGLMTYRQASSANKYNLSNSAYFTSYEPKSYCPTPPMDSATGLDYCFDWCSTGNTASRDTCNSQCQAQNISFDATYMDEVITSRSIGDALRTKYCGLVYPKTIQTKNPTDLTRYIYFKQALPYYNSGTGNQYDYAQSYPITPVQEITNKTTATVVYDHTSTKTGTSDLYVGYANNHGTSQYVLTDSDLSAGYGNLGVRMFSAYTGGRAWFSNSSPGGGYLKITAADNDNINTQKNKLLTALTTYAGAGDTAYMNTCSGDPNGCSYIVSAGLTPTAGTLRSAANYFNEATDFKSGVSYTTPIQYPCQKNYIIYVTDGAPSVNESGTEGAATTLMGADTSPATGTVLNRIDQLRSIARTIGGTDYTFDVKTYVLGMGLTDAGKTQLERMAVHGGTGQAYYADEPEQLNDALNSIFTDITTKVSSGTAASILSNNDNNGSMLLQAIFYPKKVFDAQAVSWTGELHGLWYFIDPFLMTNSIREDTPSTDNILNLKHDYVTRFKFVPPPTALTSVDRFEDTDGNGTGDVLVDNVSTDAVNSLWRAGKSLWSRNLTSSPRTIYTTDGTNRISFSTGNDTTLQPWLNVTTTSIADDIINFVKGNDISPNPLGYRGRNASISGTSGTWRLGDIISSTPRLQTGVAFNLYDLVPPIGYLDESYGRYINSNDYQNRGMAYVGGNDGMLHAFNLGRLTKAIHPADGDSFSVSKVTDYYGGGLGKEMWGFIPKNALPYLQFLADPNYSHLYYVDASPYISDVAINPVNNGSLTPPHTCADTSKYWLCDKVTTLAGNSLDTTNTSWRSVLIVGMGLGGASRNSTGTCASTTGVYPNCVNTPVANLGYSSYTALDVTDPTNPQFLWEFSNPALGYSTPGTVIARVGDKNHNGRWFAVFASGPTGPIDTINHQFMGASDQNLKIFIVDVKDGTLVRTIDTGITEAFAGSLSNAAIDTDRTTPASPGYFSDDAIYLGYVQKDTATGTWTKGGVLRIFTQENTDTSQANYGRPDQWTFSRVIDGIGPVMSGIGRIQEDPRIFPGNRSRLWLYFGTGRYFYKNSTGLDDNTTRQSLYGIIEPCYQNGDINQSCSDSINIIRSASDGLQDQTSTITTTAGELPAGKKGWVIDLANATGSTGAQRVITDTVPLVSGVVLYTAFKPTAEVCGFGGSTSLWAVTYNGGDMPPDAALQGQGVIQLSTGSFQEVQLNSGTFINSLNRESTSYQGVPPPTPPAFFTKAGMMPQKKILRIQEN